jgi:hypothetical protein
MQPKFSMDTRRLTIIFLAAMRRAPVARFTLMAGSSRGRVDRERERE